MTQRTASSTPDLWYRRVAVRAGDRLDRYLGVISPGRKYAIEVLFGLPCMLLVYSWHYFSQYSDYTIIEVILFCLRYFGTAMLLGIHGLITSQIIITYIDTYCALLIGWMLDSCYWMFQNEAYGVCRHDAILSVGDADGYWWTPALLTFAVCLITMHVLYRRSGNDVDMKYAVLLFGIPLLVLHFICTTGLLLYYLAPVYYWVSKIAFLLVFFAPILIQSGHDDNFKAGTVAANRRINVRFPGQFYLRDVLTVFGVCYFASAFGIDMLFRFEYSYMLSWKYLLEFIGDWCTNFVIVNALAACMSFISNSVIVLGRFVVMGLQEVREVFNANLGHRVLIATLLFCAEAGVLNAESEKRIENMKCVLFLASLTIVCEVWDMSEQYFLQVSNTAESRKITVYARIGLFCAFILTLPTLATFYVAERLQIDTWLMLNAAGTFLLLVRAFVSFLEFGFIQATWYLESHQDLLDDIIYYIRVLKTLSSAFCTILLSYYRFIAPFFDAWWLYRSGILVLNVIGFGYLVLVKEWQAFTARRSQLQNIPDATAEEIADLDDVCSICYTEITSGKRLPCSHIFHAKCLRRCLQQQMACPLCNANVNRQSVN